MKRIVPHETLAEGWEPAPPPVLASDGMPQFAALRHPLPPRPSLCQRGPCIHYHSLTVQVDAESPRAKPVPIRLPAGPGVRAAPQGSVYQAPASFHTREEHYCYPTAGIEIDLGAMPVVRCSRYRCCSADDEGRTADEEDRADLAAFDLAVQNWEAERLREADEAREVERLINETETEQP